MSDNGPPPDNARCARCGGPFRCGAADVRPCACTSIELTPALLAQLQQQYRGCLCLVCLQALPVTPPAPAR